MTMTAPPNNAVNLYDVLAERGLVAQVTDEAMRGRLNKPVVAYCGFDPTADSLHVGSLVPIMALAHLQRCGHKPLVLVGGATGLIGDPSGKTDARKMLSPEQVNHNAQAIGRQIGQVVRFEGEMAQPAKTSRAEELPGAILVNNADWFARKGWLEMLREVGPHFSVNRMLSMESVKSRLGPATGNAKPQDSGLKTQDASGGLSFLEFSYMLMQGYDFLHLYREFGCTLQLGGQDQWGNIVMGIDLGRRLASAELLGLTLPLVVKADGGKFGKSEAGNIWLDPARTSPYDFYQFWRNVADADVGKFLGYFTFVPMSEVRELADREGQALNDAKERLAFEVTRMIHGKAEAEQARDSARKAFGSARDVTGESIPSASLDGVELDEGVGLINLMARAGLAGSNSEARRLIEGGGVRIHDDKVADVARLVTRADIQEGYILIRVGKKRLFRYDVPPEVTPAPGSPGRPGSG